MTYQPCETGLLDNLCVGRVFQDTPSSPILVKSPKNALACQNLPELVLIQVVVPHIRECRPISSPNQIITNIEAFRAGFRLIR
jgi:hypothetical protein